MRNRVAWILGSGFSRSIGGPLLDELMGQARWERIQQISEFSHLVPVWEKLVWFWKTYSGKHAQWTDAEGFIEWVELMSAVEIPMVQTLSAHFPNQPVSQIARTCRKYLAAVTYEFTSRANPDLERWQPYRAWAALLQPQDTVVSFNYDQVVENAYKAACQGEQIATTLTTATPGQLNKVHGSVDWIVGENDSILVMDPLRAIASTAEQLIGVPGPQKMSSCGTILQPQWQAGLTAILQADVIVFVGYRFPPSDSYARHFLIDAIRKNSSESLTVRIILGPMRDEHVIRVESLVSWVLRTRRKPARVVHEALWAQDFLTVFDRGELQ